MEYWTSAVHFLGYIIFPRQGYLHFERDLPIQINNNH